MGSLCIIPPGKLPSELTPTVQILPLKMNLFSWMDSSGKSLVTLLRKRSCAIYNLKAGSELKELVAEIKRKVDPDTNVMLGKDDVFLLCLEPSVDGAFMMALMLVLDRMGGVDMDDTNQAPTTTAEDTTTVSS